MGTLYRVKCLVMWQILSFVLSLRQVGSTVNWLWHVLSSRVVSCVFLLFGVQRSHCLDSNMTDSIVLFLHSSLLERWTSPNFLSLREASFSSQHPHTVRLWLNVITAGCIFRMWLMVLKTNQPNGSQRISWMLADNLLLGGFRNMTNPCVLEYYIISYLNYHTFLETGDVRMNKQSICTK